MTQLESLQTQLVDYQSRIRAAAAKDEALKLAIEAAEACMKALKLSKKEESAEIKARCQHWLDEAERIKATTRWNTENSVQSTSSGHIVNPAGDPTCAPKSGSDSNALPSSQATALKVIKLPEPESTRELTTTEKLLLARASQLNGFRFPPWTKEPDPSEFVLEDGAPLYSDTIELPLSEHQRQFLDGWKRAKDALPPPGYGSADGEPLELVISPKNIPTDLVQDAASDCSVVASLCAVSARMRRGHEPIMYRSIWPRNNRTDHPEISPNGKYVLKMYFNGCWRRVVIDDFLPVSKTSRMLHVVDRNNPSYLLPPLVEKAYLKVRGGYDFPGSSSASDLWAFSGWIPEQIFLQDEEVISSQLWKRIHKAFEYGDVLVTVGTGKIKHKDEKELGLESQHNYAVLDMKDAVTGPMLQIKNPWVEGKGWRGQRSQASPYTQCEVVTTNIYKGWNDVPMEDSGSTGVFWISLNSVMQFFESFFLNWNPGLFRFREDVHFPWNIEPGNEGARFIIDNPQYSITTQSEGMIWLLLCRHFKDRNSRTSQPHSSGDETGHAGLHRSHSDNLPEGFMSLSIHDRNGERVYLDEADIERGPLVNTPQALLRWKCPAKGIYTIVVNHQELEPSTYTFTLSAFSDMKVSLASAQSKYPRRTEIASAWTASTAGGNSQLARYGENPQFALTIPQPTPVALLIETPAQQASVNAQILHGRGERVHALRTQDLVLNTGTYRHGYAFAESPSIMPGKYTVVCSTFEPGQLANFILRVDANCECTLTPVSKEGAGMLSSKLGEACFGTDIDRIAAPLLPHRLTRLNAVVRFQKSRSANASHSARAGGAGRTQSPLRVTVELGRGPDTRVLLESNGGEFSNAGTVRTDFIDISPEISKRGVDIFLVLERLRAPADGSEELYDVQIFHDVPNAFTVGSWRNWD